MTGSGNLARLLVLVALTAVACGVVPTARAFDATIVRTDSVDSTCVSAGTSHFTAGVRIRTPGTNGPLYVTLRLSIPDAIALQGTPALHPAVRERIVTAYPDGTEEWNLILEGCPGGWIPLLTQEFAVTGTDGATLSISGADSWIRACDFSLHRVNVLADLRLNRANCGGVTVTPRGWSTLKGRYRSLAAESSGR